MSSTNSTQSMLAKVAEYVEAITRNPGSKVFVPLAEIYCEVGMLDAAVPLITKGIRANPDYGPGYIVLGRLFMAQEKPEDARKAFLKATKLEKKSLPAYKGLLEVLWSLEDEEGARQTAETILRIDPMDEESQKTIDRLPVPTFAEKLPSDSEEQTERESGGAFESEEPIKTGTLADIYVKQGLYKKALNLYRQILSRDPANQEIQRKADVIEQRLQEQGGSAAQSAPTVDEVPRTGSQASTVPPRVETDPRTERIGKLQGWLDSIQKRRGHVH